METETREAGGITWEGEEQESPVSSRNPLCCRQGHLHPRPRPLWHNPLDQTYCTCLVGDGCDFVRDSPRVETDV
jgi:hypothetical protein